jgi:predicted ATP-grasp superfamily ATP-dependent carboligase
MELKDMTFPQVLSLQVFREELDEQMQIERKALNDAGKLHNRVVLQELIRRGEFDAEKMTAAYYHIMHKEAVCLSARERQYITDVCTLAYSRTIRRLQNESEENSRNPLLRLVRWVLAKLNINIAI